jgi:hypothetical protein
VLRRLALAAVLLGILGAALTVAARGASHRIYVERDIVGQELAFRPHAIGLSADGTFAMSAIRYRSYGGAVARASARAYVRGCTPDCAQGKVYRPTASMRLGDQIQCRGVRIYSRLRYVLRGPLPSGFRRQGTELLRPLGAKGC